MTQNDVINLLGIDDEMIDEQRDLIEQVADFANKFDVKDLAFQSDINIWITDVEVIHKVTFNTQKGKVPIAILEYGDSVPSTEELLGQLEEPTNTYEIVTPWLLDHYNFHENTFKVVDFDEDDGMFLIEALEEKDRSTEPYETWVHTYDIRKI